MKHPELVIVARMPCATRFDSETIWCTGYFDMDLASVLWGNGLSVADSLSMEISIWGMYVSEI